MADYKAKSAQEVVAVNGPIESDHKERAAEAGVTDVAFIDYAEALANYEARPDVETLEQRRAREAGDTFEAANFRREIASVENTGLVSTDSVVASKQVDSNVDRKAVAKQVKDKD